MDADFIKALLKELKDDISAQNKHTSDALVAQMTEQSKQFTDALNEVQGNIEQVRREFIENDRPLDEWGEEQQLQNQSAAAPNQSSRQEDDLDSSRQEHRKASRDSRKETTVKEARGHSKGREHKQSQDARHNNNGPNNAQGERNFYHQNYRPPSNNAQPPNAQQQPSMQQSPPLNLSKPPNMQQQAQQFNGALVENMAQVRREMAGNGYLGDNWQQEEETHVQLATAPQYSASVQEDDENGIGERERSSRVDKNHETPVYTEQYRKRSKSRDDDQSQDACGNFLGGGKNSLTEMIFWDGQTQQQAPILKQQSNMPPPNANQPPYLPPPYSQPPPPNLQQPPNMYQLPNVYQLTN
ncbi:MAG: hypothetical protein GY820_01680, partial [Gammaproteobacteria bacterium]|nr:hypothetical protein [Gammaproteobacteria bacterium]